MRSNACRTLHSNAELYTAMQAILGRGCTFTLFSERASGEESSLQARLDFDLVYVRVQVHRMLGREWPRHSDLSLILLMSEVASVNW